jgi:hypothetical protein
MKDWKERVIRAVNLARTILENEGLLCPTAFIYGDDFKILARPWGNDEEKEKATALFRDEARRLNATLFFFIGEACATDPDTGRQARVVDVYVQSAVGGEWSGLAFITQKKSWLDFITQKKGYQTFGPLDFAPLAERAVGPNRFIGLLPSEMKKILAEIERELEEVIDQAKVEQRADGLYRVLCRKGAGRILDAGTFSTWAANELQRELCDICPEHKEIIKLLRRGLPEELIEKAANMMAERLRAAVLEIARRHGPR